jgi:Ca-activated chloride channel family protein
MGNYNDDLMEQLADQGDGFYAYVDTFAEARRLFVEDITSTLTTVAGDARTQVEFDPAAVTAYRLIGYDNRALDDDDFTDTGVDAGEIGAGHHVTALYEVRLADAVAPQQEVGAVHTRWVSADSGEVQQIATPITAADPVAEPSPQLRLAATVADFAQLLKGSEPVAGRGLTLDSLAARAADLQAEGVPGADELADLIGQTSRR